MTGGGEGVGTQTWDALQLLALPGGYLSKSYTSLSPSAKEDVAITIDIFLSV